MEAYEKLFALRYTNEPRIARRKAEIIASKGKYEMDARWKKNVFWVATIIAVLIVVVVLADYVSNAGEGEPIIPIIPLLIAGAIWLVGVAFSIFSSRR